MALEHQHYICSFVLKSRKEKTLGVTLWRTRATDP
jgi:hypothetical protein